MKAGKAFYLSVLKLTAVLCCFGAPAVNAHETLVLSHDSFPPYVYLEAEDGGVATAFVREVLSEIGFDMKPVILDWSDALHGAMSGEFDGMISAWKTEERERFLAYSKPYMFNRLAIASKQAATADLNVVKTVDDLFGSNVGLIENYAYPESFASSTIFSRWVAPDLETNLLRLAHGRIDFVIEERRVIEYTFFKMMDNQRLRPFDLF